VEEEEKEKEKKEEEEEKKKKKKKRERERERPIVRAGPCSGFGSVLGFSSRFSTPHFTDVEEVHFAVDNK